jgi:non-ribosomal peptide synthetase component F
MFSGLSRLPALDLEMSAAPWRRQPETNPEWSGIGDHAQSLAYIMYTSGSTGLPKGAMIEHRGLLNHLCAKIQDLGLTSADVVAQNASQSFDISVWQCLAALLVGGQVFVIEDDIAHDPILLPKEVDRARVTIFETVPTMLRAMLDSLSEIDASERPQFSNLRWLISNAEALPEDLCQKWFAIYPANRMINTWGATECSDDVTHFHIERTPNERLSSMPLGFRLGNIQLYIVDRDMLPVPIGVPGELCIAGVSVG